MRFGRGIVFASLGSVALSASIAAADVLRVDFSDWDRSLWRPVREERFPQIVPFVQHRDYIENLIPVGPSEKDIVAMKDGIGGAIMLLRDFCGSDVAVRSTMAFERKGAPAILFRAQREGDVIGQHYSLVLYAQGVNLWKFSNNKFTKIAAAKFPVTPAEFHEMRLYARGGDFTVFVDGQKKMTCSDPEPLPAGEVGLWSGEGPCKFKNFSQRPIALQ